MDTIFGIGPGELFVILFLAGIVMGPKRIQSTARLIGKWTVKLQGVSRGFMRQLNNELDGAGQEELRGAMDELSALRDQVASLQADVKSAGTSLAQETEQVMDEAKQELDAVNEEIASVNGTRKSADTPNIPVKPTNSIAPPQPTTNGSAKPKLPTALDIPDDPEI